MAVAGILALIGPKPGGDTDVETGVVVPARDAGAWRAGRGLHVYRGKPRPGLGEPQAMPPSINPLAILA